MLKQVTAQVKCRGGGNSALWLAVMEEKVVYDSITKYAATRSSAVGSFVRWGRKEQNALFNNLFGRVAELNWMWKESMDEFTNQYLNYRRYFKTIFQHEKEVEDERKTLLILHRKVMKARKQLDYSLKKGDVVRSCSQENELELLSVQYDKLQENLIAAVNQLEVDKVMLVRKALEEQANAFVEMSEKCRSIFTTQQAMVELIPSSADNTFLSTDHSALYRHYHTLVGLLSEKLRLAPPAEGGVDSAETLGLFVAPVTDRYRTQSDSVDHLMGNVNFLPIIPVNPNRVAMASRTGNIGPPIPVRSEISLEGMSDVIDEAIYVVPNVAFSKNKQNENGLATSVEEKGFTRSYSDSNILYTSFKPPSTTPAPVPDDRILADTSTPVSPIPHKMLPDTSQKSCPLFKDSSLSPDPEDEDPYSVPADVLRRPRSQSDYLHPVIATRVVSNCPRLVKVRGSSRRKKPTTHAPVTRISQGLRMPPMLKALSLDSLSVAESEDDEIYSNPYDLIHSQPKPLHVTRSTSTSACQPVTPTRKVLSRSVDHLDMMGTYRASSPLGRQPQHDLVNDGVMEIQTYPDSPTHLRVGSQEHLFFGESTPLPLFTKQGTPPPRPNKGKATPPPRPDKREGTPLDTQQTSDGDKSRVRKKTSRTTLSGIFRKKLSKEQ